MDGAWMDGCCFAAAGLTPNLTTQYLALCVVRHHKQPVGCIGEARPIVIAAVNIIGGPALGVGVGVEGLGLGLGTS